MQILFMICITIVNTYYLNLNLNLELLLKCILFIGIANFLWNVWNIESADEELVTSEITLLINTMIIRTISYNKKKMENIEKKYGEQNKKCYILICEIFM